MTTKLTEFVQFKQDVDLINEHLEYLEEKLLLSDKGKKGGQIIFLAGGAGSGKGFALQKFIDSSGYKVRDVDEWKEGFLKLAKLKNKYPEIKDLNLKNPKDVSKLHEFVSQKGIKEKTLNNMLASLSGKSQERLPNIVFDITLKDLKDMEEYSEMLQEVGYEAKNMHIIWSLANFNIALERNRKRDRVVADDILLSTHKGAAKAMTKIIDDGISQKLIDGEIHVILANNEETEFYRDSNGEIVISGDRTGKAEEGKPTEKPIGGDLKKAGDQDKETEDPPARWTVKNFTSLQIKAVGKPVNSKDYKEENGKVTSKTLQDQIYQWMKNNVPQSAKKEIFGE